jgi:nitrogen fixation protein NifU and related proteins
MSDDKPPTFSEHSRRFQEMLSRTDRYGAQKKADGYGQACSTCGDMIEFFLRLRAERLQLVTFQVRGCIHMVACGNTVSILSEGRNCEDAWQINAADVASYLQTLAREQYHCAELAVSAFLAALADCQRLRREPWKKMYRRS